MRILFVCMGNICRSPTAEAMLRHLLRREAPDLHIEVDSAGVHGFHAGDAPDPRAIAAAHRRGINMDELRARQLMAADFERFDLILVMDHENYRDVTALAPAAARARVRRLMDYASDCGVQEVPDPYYGGPQDFEQVLDLVEVAVRGLLPELRLQATRALLRG